MNDTPTEREKILAKLEKLVRLAGSALLRPILQEAQQILNSDKTWEEKYDLIFSDDVSKAFSKLNPQFEYCDPDTSYEEDVTAWFEAAKWFAFWNPDLTNNSL